MDRLVTKIVRRSGRIPSLEALKMRKPTMILAFLAVAGAMANAQVIRVQQHDGATDPFGKYFEAGSQQTISGHVRGIATARPVTGGDANETILVQTGSTMTTVQLGPRWYVKDQVARIHMGSKVQVTGSWVRVNGQPEILASMVRINGQGGPVLALRRLSGRAFWMSEETTVATNQPTKPKKVASNEPTEQQQAENQQLPIPPQTLRVANGLQTVDVGAQWTPYGNQVSRTNQFTTLVSGAYPFVLRPW